MSQALDLIKIRALLAALDLTTLDGLGTLLGTPAGASLAADIAAIQVVVDAMNPEIMLRLGAPVGASLSADVAALTTIANAIGALVTAVKASTDAMDPEVMTRLGAPAGASLAADILAVFVNSDTIKNVLFDVQYKINAALVSIKLVAPSLGTGITLTTGAGAGWAYGAYAEVLAAAAMAASFRVIGLNVEEITTPGAQFQIAVASGAGGSEMVIGTVRGADLGFYPLSSELVDANARIAMKTATRLGLSDTIKVSLVYAAATA